MCDDLFNKYNLKMNDAVIAEDRHLLIYKEFLDNYDVVYTAGGSTQVKL